MQHKENNNEYDTHSAIIYNFKNQEFPADYN